MAMAHVSSSSAAGSAYLRTSSPHPLVSAAELTSKYLVDGHASSYPSSECPPPSSSSGWHVGSGDMHFLSSEAPMKMATSTGAMSLQQQAAANFGPEVLNAMSSSNGGEWQQFVDLGIQSYSSSITAPSSVLPPASSAPEAARSRPVSYSSPTQGIDKAAANAWGALTVDPSKGGLALQGLSSQCFAEFPSDPGFAERAARYSSFHSGPGGYQSPNKQLSRSSSLRGDAAGSAAAEDAVKSALEDGKIYSKLHKVAQEAKDDSMSSAQNSIEQGTTSSRKRKIATDKDAAAPARKDSKNGESDEGKASTKRQKGSDGKEKDDAKAKTDKSGSENSGSSSPKSAKENPKPPEAPKQDYIHVRARRGQATDSHSLAERVRREKISERMKFLQDLVPGCSKVTGKAVMLDEIINYVQSLQRQVEFLSMKLAAVNPRLDLNLDGLLAKEALHGRSSLLSHDMSANYTHLQQQLQHAQQQLGSCGLELRSLDKPAVSVASEAFAGAASQLAGVWDGELQSVVQMFGLPTPQGRVLPQELQGHHLPAGHMKVEI